MRTADKSKIITTRYIINPIDKNGTINHFFIRALNPDDRGLEIGYDERKRKIFMRDNNTGQEEMADPGGLGIAEKIHLNILSRGRFGKGAVEFNQELCQIREEMLSFLKFCRARHLWQSMTAEQQRAAYTIIKRNEIKTHA